MEKSASDALKNGSKPPPRRSPRTAPSEALVNLKRSMKQKAELSPGTDFVKDDYEAAQNAKNMVRKGTGVVYDSDFAKHYCFWDCNYPESPDRYLSVIKRCNDLGLIDRCKRIPARNATEKELLELHSPEHVELLKSTSGQMNYDLLEEISSKFDSIYLNKYSYTCATLAAGGALSLVDAICNDEVQNGMAIIRPPGHHAMKDEYCGYCLFNNAALAAKYAIKKGLDRILIVDWDVHHGQGTQQMFYDEPRIIYFSVHRYENGTFWPELRESNFDYIGEKSGKGFNFNVPLNATGATDADYIAIWHQVLLPMAYQYEPELIIISAGYDAALGCPEIQPDIILVSAGYDSALGDEKVNLMVVMNGMNPGEMQLSPACYAHLTKSLMGLAKGKIAVLLEGGYCLKSLSESAALTLRCLLGDPTPSLYDFGAPSDSVVNSILNVLYVHKPYWQCFQTQESYSLNSPAADPKKTKKNEKQSSIFPPNRKYRPMIRYEKTREKERPTSYETRNCYRVLSPEEAKKYDEMLNTLISKTDLSCPVDRVCIAYSECMAEHQSITDVDHPEKPERITEIYKRHEEYGLLNRCVLLQPRSATKEELLLVHDENYVKEMEKTSEFSAEELTEKAGAYDSVYLHPKTYECALLSAGCLLQVVDEVVGKKCRSGVAIVRPPGHHAESNAACGFCLFNNVSLAAKYALENHGLKRILLLDWDVHHGNGTQRMFESDDRVLYISLHRYNNGKFFPSSTDANYDKVGVGKGEGYNVNIPWNKPGGGMGDGDYLAAFFAIILPIAYQFNPELVLVSAGFDACIHDPLGNCKVTPEFYAHMTNLLTSLANGRVILSLEGGYNVSSISYAMTLCTKALLGDPFPPLTSVVVPSASALETIRNVLATHEKYWSCLRFNRVLPLEDVLQEKPLEENIVVTPKADSDGLNDLLVETLKKLRINSQTPESDSNPKPQDGNESGERNRGGNRPVDSSSGGGNASGHIGRPTLVEYLSENMQRLLNEEMFAIVPLPGCPHLVEVQAVPSSGISVQTPCAACNSDQENWICLICYSVYCARYINQHMIMHNEDTHHPLTLSFTDLSVWCYVCEAYIDNMILYPAKNAVHRSKFGSDLQWSYGSERRAPPPSM